MLKWWLKNGEAASFLRRRKMASSSEIVLETVKAGSYNGKRGAEQRSNTKHQKADARKGIVGQNRNPLVGREVSRRRRRAISTNPKTSVESE